MNWSGQNRLDQSKDNFFFRIGPIKLSGCRTLVANRLCFLVFMICQFACNHLCPCCSFIYDSLFSCKDRALERDRPHQRKKSCRQQIAGGRWIPRWSARILKTVDPPKGNGLGQKKYRPPCSPSCSSLLFSLFSSSFLLALLLAPPCSSPLLSSSFLLALLLAPPCSG